MNGGVEQPPAVQPAEETAPSFDLSKKKKKKKAKTGLALGSEPAGYENGRAVEAVTNALASQKLSNGNTTGPVNGTEGEEGLGDHGYDGDEGLGDQGDAAAATSAASGMQPQQSLDFALPTFGGKKKKKKKKKVDFDDDRTNADGELISDSTSTVDENGNVSKKKVERNIEPQPWDGTDRDYTYVELVNRAFQFLYGKNPMLAGGTSQRKRVRMELPQVAREGTKKTVFFNFGSTCKSIHRPQEHFLAYLCAELGTTGNIQEGGRLVIKGRFSPEGIANVLKRYMLEYVMCRSCRSPDTVLMRDANTRLYFVSCESCGAKRSVAPIRQGFMAQVEKRKK